MIGLRQVNRFGLHRYTGLVLAMSGSLMCSCSAASPSQPAPTTSTALSGTSTALLDERSFSVDFKIKGHTERIQVVRRCHVPGEGRTVEGTGGALAFSVPTDEFAATLSCLQSQPEITGVGGFG
jgi:hypothetical protein